MRKLMIAVAAAAAIASTISLMPNQAAAMNLSAPAGVSEAVDTATPVTKVWYGWHHRHHWRGRWHGPRRFCGWGWHRVCGPYRCWCVPN